MKQTHYKFIIALGLITILASCNINKKKNSTNTESPELTEANKNFTYKGKPINPWVLAEISGYDFSGGVNAIVSVDITRAYEITKTFKISKYSEFEESETDPKASSRSIKNENGYINGYNHTFRDEIDGSLYFDSNGFSYKWLGKLNSDVHVLQTTSNEGGAMTTEQLLFVKFYLQKDLSSKAKEERLIMTKISNKFMTEPRELNVILDSTLNKVKVSYVDFENYDKKMDFEIQF